MDWEKRAGPSLDGMHLSCNGFTRYKGSKTARECIQSIQDHQHFLDLDLKAVTSATCSHSFLKQLAQAYSCSPLLSLSSRYRVPSPCQSRFIPLTFGKGTRAADKGCWWSWPSPRDWEFGSKVLIELVTGGSKPFHSSLACELALKWVPSSTTIFAPLLRQIGFSHCIASYNYTKRKASSSSFPARYSWNEKSKVTEGRLDQRTRYDSVFTDKEMGLEALKSTFGRWFIDQLS